MNKKYVLIFDKLEVYGPVTGNLLDSKLNIYEIKMKSPPIRLYYHHISNTGELEVFEFEMKKSSKKQSNTINKLRRKISKS